MLKVEKADGFDSAGFLFGSVGFKEEAVAFSVFTGGVFQGTNQTIQMNAASLGIGRYRRLFFIRSGYGARGCIRGGF